MFTPLFGESSKGKRKRWEVSVEEREGHGHITVTHGYEDGKQVVSERVVTSGKNLGKKNATTPYQQSLLEARALWKKKTDAGYAEGDPTPLPEEVYKPPSPMLAHDFNKRGKDIVFPCYAQRKLDGVRCMAVSQRSLFSRNGKRLSPHLQHVQREVDQLPKDTVLDGELYSDTLTFQEIVGLVKKVTLGEGDDAKLQSIYLCVYDVVKLDTSFEARNAWLTRTFEGLSAVGMRLLPTVVCATQDAMEQLHAAYVAEGYEGIMLRNKAGLYSVSHRSKDLQKFKHFEDDEFVVCGYKTGDGSEKECVIWICLTSDNKHFAVRPRGTHQERQAALLTADSKVSCMYTVRYQELTSDGIPRFPVGIGFRDFE